MVLYDTKNNLIISDAVELIPGIWVHQDNRHICTDAQIGKRGSGKRYALLPDDAPEVLAAQETEQELEQRENLLRFLLPSEDMMPIWYNNFIKSFNDVETGKQAGIRDTASFTSDQWLSYLCDSSFPSTFLAGYRILRNYLNNTAVQKEFEKLKCVRIADIGCGNGGASLGALTALVELFPNLVSITIYAYDFSTVALKMFNECLDFIKSQTSISFRLEAKRVAFIPQNKKKRQTYQHTLDSFGEQILSNKKFDIILSFKMINELIFNHNFNLSTAYYEMIRCLAPHLSEIGCMAILDISMSAEKDGDGNNIDNNSYGKELNRQSRCFERDNNQFKAVIPIPCSLIERGCPDNGYCKQQRLFASNKGRVFPATYKVIVRTELANKILAIIPQHEPKEYIVEETKDGVKNRCGYDDGRRWVPVKERACTEEETLYDGYDLKA